MLRMKVRGSGVGSGELSWLGGDVLPSQAPFLLAGVARTLPPLAIYCNQHSLFLQPLLL